MFKRLRYDIASIKRRDPAARSSAEVFFLYSGLHAVLWYRIAHWFYKHHRFFLARWCSQAGRWFTGIEIHPGAQIGKGLFIDHGSGVVIGETAIIGDDCTIYQGVTLGGVGLNKGKRHPTLGNNVTVGAGAKILGAFEVGDNCSIAANAVLLKPLENNVTAVGIPARPVKKDGIPIPKEKFASVESLGHNARRIQELEERVRELESLVKKLAEEKTESVQRGELQK